MLFAKPALAVTSMDMEAVGNSAGMIAIGHIVGFDESANSIFENPAAFSRNKAPSITTFYTTTMAQETQFYTVGFSLPFGPGNFGIGQFQSRIPNNPVTGATDSDEFYQADSFDYKLSILKLAYGLPLSAKSSVGIVYNLTTLDEYTTHAQAHSLDLGYQTQLDALTLSLTGKNIVPLSPLTFESGKTETLPIRLIGGFKWQVTSEWSVFGQLSQTANSPFLKAGGIQFTPTFLAKMLVLSAGMQERHVQSSIKQRGALGVGLFVSPIIFHFAYEKSDYVVDDNHYYVSFAFNFAP
ncbi:MAG: hypothetical protein AB7F28_02975 [Candidatus Margulisiibacteriota bacterium]